MKVHDLNDGVVEHFEFSVNKHLYKFRHMTTSEMETLQKLEGKDKESKEYLYTFITKVNSDSPDFGEVAQKMIVPQWSKFRDMIKAEFGA